MKKSKPNEKTKDADKVKREHDALIRSELAMFGAPPSVLDKGAGDSPAPKAGKK